MEVSVQKLDEKKIIKQLKRSDRFVLLAIAHMQGEAYGVPLNHMTKYNFGRLMLIGERLERLGLVESELVPGSPARGRTKEGESRRKRIYRMTNLGDAVLGVLTEIAVG